VTGFRSLAVADRESGQVPGVKLRWPQTEGVDEVLTLGFAFRRVIHPWADRQFGELKPPAVTEYPAR